MQQGRYFLIDRDSGTIWTAKHLDREVLAEISFTVRATDGGLPARHSDVTVTVTVDDINDNSPVFGMVRFETIFFAHFRDVFKQKIFWFIHVLILTPQIVLLRRLRLNVSLRSYLNGG